MKKKKECEQANLAAENTNDDATTQDSEEVALALLDGEIAVKNMEDQDQHLFIGDTGASCHMTGSLDGMFDLHDIDEQITVGNGQVTQATKRGKKRGEITDENGVKHAVVLNNVKYVPDLAPNNLFSITYALSHGFSIGNKGETIYLRKNDFTLSFNHCIPTKTGYVAAVEIRPHEATADALAAPTLGK